MKAILSKITLITSLLFAITTYSQVIGIHSHNDYEHKVPFWEAYYHNATSIEVDVFYQNGELFVAHEKNQITPQRTLKKLYLTPIEVIYKHQIIQSRPFQLLVDIKTEAEPTLQALVSTLQPYQKYLYPYNPKGVKIVISGNKPKAIEYANYPKHIYFDYQSVDIPKDVNKIALISFSFKDFSKWNGKGKIIKREEKALKNVIDLVHKHQLPIRFWNTPDSKSAWYSLKTLGVDFINTDTPAKAETYLKHLTTNVTTIKCSKNSYQPTYKSDNTNTRVKNVILFIGDGTGLAHISTAANLCPDMMFNKFKHIGFSKTESANDYTTDSAAGGTALAIGEKTNNRHIGVDKNDIPQKNLVEILSAKGFQTAVITTDEITGATPASFYAHATDRDLTEKISNDLIKSNLKFFMGGGRKFFKENNLNNRLQEQQFKIVNRFSELDNSAERIAFFAGDDSVPYMKDGRKNLLPKTTEYAINYLKDKPFL